jgi:hypothetical protein
VNLDIHQTAKHIIQDNLLDFDLGGGELAK